MTGEERQLATRRILAVAERLSAVREHLVFIGGTVLPLLVNVDKLFYAPRMTDDVDAVGIATGYVESTRVETAVRAAGYTVDPTSKHKGRWISKDGEVFDLSFAGDFPGASGALVDRMAIETAQEMEGHPEVRHLSPTGLFLMKCAAYGDRGKSRPAESKDLADLAVLLVGTDIEKDVSTRSEAVRAEVKRRAELLLADRGARGALLSHFSERYPIPPDTPEELADAAVAVLTRLAE